MKIVKYQIEQATLMPADSTWRISGFSIPTYEGSIVTLTAEDGTTGEGYGAPYTFLGETPSGCREALELICKRLVDQPAMSIHTNMQIVRKAIRGHQASKAAADCALHDLVARVLKVPLYQILGGKARSRIPLMRILTLKTPDAMGEQARKRVDEGYRYVKIKLVGDVAEDVQRVKSVRKAVGDDIFITVDPNQAYGAKDAIAFSRQSEEYRILLIEQPVRDTDLEGLKEVTRQTSAKIEADKSASTVEQAIDLIAMRRVDGINLKVPRCGGIADVMTIGHMCDAAGITYRMGANVGSRLITAQAIHVAAALPNIVYASELAEFERLQNDPYEGLTIVDGDIMVPDEIGSGVHRRKTH